METMQHVNVRPVLRPVENSSGQCHLELKLTSGDSIQSNLCRLSLDPLLKARVRHVDNELWRLTLKIRMGKMEFENNIPRSLLFNKVSVLT